MALTKLVNIGKIYKLRIVYKLIKMVEEEVYFVRRYMWGGRLFSYDISLLLSYTTDIFKESLYG